MKTFTAFAIIAFATAPAFGGPAEPKFSPTGPNAAEYGEAEGYPIGTRTTTFQIPHLVGVQSHYDQVFPARPVARSAATFQFKRAAEEANITYQYQSSVYNVDDYL